MLLWHLCKVKFPPLQKSHRAGSFGRFGRNGYKIKESCLTSLQDSERERPAMAWEDGNVKQEAPEKPTNTKSNCQCLDVVTGQVTTLTHPQQPRGFSEFLYYVNLNSIIDRKIVLLGFTVELSYLTVELPSFTGSDQSSVYRVSSVCWWPVHNAFSKVSKDTIADKYSSSC